MSRPGQCLAIALGLVAGAQAGCAAPPVDPSPLLGTWTFERGGRRELSCQGEIVTGDIGGTTIVLRETASGGLDLELGCRCNLHMNGDGRLSPTRQPCGLAMAPSDNTDAYDIAATVDVWDVALMAGNPERLVSTARGTAVAKDVYGNGFPEACSFSITGTLVRSEAVPACGADDTAVGVVPASDANRSNCPVGAGRDGLLIVMPSDTTTGCATQLGNSGEERWVHPAAVKVLPACRGMTVGRSVTPLGFCRVDGALFTPADESYAVLMLGDRCPAGAERVTRFIDNDSNTPGGLVGDIRPNVITGDAISVTTTLEFCLFSPLPAGEQTVSFPALGFPYAVFHDFDASAPAWVTSKRWVRSDDESDSTNSSHYRADDAEHGAALIEKLSRMVESKDTDTVFDMARVR